MVKVKRALLSVSDKTGLEALAAVLARHGVELVSTGGTGFGLAITLEIVRGHNGTLAARNHPEGGAVFEICVPREAPGAA